MLHTAQPTTPRTSDHPAHNILLTLPRTASHLLVRILNLPNQPSLYIPPCDGYFFMASLRYRYQHDTYSRPIARWTDQEYEGMRVTLQADFATWEKWVQDAELGGNGTFVKEHINFMLRPDAESAFLYTAGHETEGNPTCIPDVFLQTVRPTFLIRHPGLAIPSLMRAALDLEGMETVSSSASEHAMRCEASYRWHVALFKHFEKLKSHPRESHDADDVYPIVLDASDLSNPTIVKKYAAAVGLDPQLVRFDWESTDDENLWSLEARLKDTLLRSNGVIIDKLVLNKQTDIGELTKQCVIDFGGVLGARVMRLTEDATADYEWLFERRTQF